MKKSRLAIITTSVVIILCVTSQISLATANAAYQDEFTSSTLQSCWSFTNPTGAASNSLSVQPGYLRITAPFGSKLSTIAGSNLNAPRMLQPVTDNFEASTYVSGTFNSVLYRGGLLLWKDNINFVRLEKYGATQVLMYPIINGAEVSPMPSPVTVPSSSTTSLYLKLERNGQTVTGYYRINEAVAWTAIKSYTFSSDPVKIGLFTIDAETTGSFSADFDYFRISPSSTLSVLPEYPLGIIGASAAIAGAWVFFKAKNSRKPM